MDQISLTDEQLLEELTLDRTITGDGTIEYRLDGKLHRTFGPAAIMASGTEYWHQHGELHRDGGPAVIYDKDWQLWYQNGVNTPPVSPTQKTRCFFIFDEFD